jgi:tetratricopeptide (TPR) repeat protein
MDGRWKWALTGVFAGLVGCTTTTTPPNSFPALPPPPPPPSTVKNSVFVPEPADEVEKKTGPVGASTKVLYANMCVDAVAKDPNRPAPDRERTLGQARQMYQEVLAGEPKNLEALTGLGDLYQVTGEQDRLTEVVARVTKLHATNAKAWAWVAVKHGQAKNWVAAADAYGRAIKLDPDNRTYRIHLGLTQARAGRYDEAYVLLARSMREAEARYNLAMMMLHNGDAERAKAELESCLKADPNFAPATEQLAALATGSEQPGATPAAVPPIATPPTDERPGGVEELAPVQLGTGR